MALADPKTKKILVVDDDESQVDVLEHALRKEGFQVFTALNGKDAKAKMSSVGPDLVTMDLMIPGAGGLELVRHLQSEGMSSIPVIVITGRYSDSPVNDEQILRMEPNVRDFLKKPIHIAKLVMRVHQLLETEWSKGAKPSQA